MDVWKRLTVEAEEAAANALHRRRWFGHRLFWRADVRSLGYCCACMPRALEVVDATRDTDGNVLTLEHAAK